MKKILYIFGKDRSKHLESKIEFPNNLLYGYDFLKRHNYNPGILTKKSKFLSYLDFPINYIFNRKFGVGFNLFFIIFNLSQIRKYDLVICAHDSVALPLLFLKKIGFLKCEICDISVGLDISLPNIKKKSGNIFIASLLERAKYVFVFSKAEQETIRRLLKVKCYLIKYGVDINFFCPAKRQVFNREKIIISIGHDSKRDYISLLRAWEIIQRHRAGPNLLIITSRIHKKKIVNEILNCKIKKIQVKLTENFSYKGIRELYARMIFGIIPIKKVERSVGQVATLSMIAMGKNVLTGVNSWQAQYQLDEQNGLYFYLPENYLDLSEKMLQMIKDDNISKQTNGSGIIKSKYSSEIMTNDMLKVMKIL